MAIDFYLKTDRLHTSCLFSLLYTDYIKLTETFEEFERLTGVFIDPYGTTHLGAGHINTLARLVSAEHPSFKSFLDEWGSKDEYLTLEGD